MGWHVRLVLGKQGKGDQGNNVCAFVISCYGSVVATRQMYVRTVRMYFHFRELQEDAAAQHRVPQQCIVLQTLFCHIKYLCTV